MYYLYKITNLVNSKIYIGVHKTEDLDDGYIGSGTYLKRAIEKYGIESFSKEIIEFFDNVSEMYLAEKHIVNEEFLKRNDVYNIARGGHGGWYHTKNMVTVRDTSTGKCFNVTKDDPRYLSGELKHVFHGLITVRDKTGETLVVESTDDRLKTGELEYMAKDKIIAKDNNGNIFQIDKDDERFKNGTLTGISKNRIWIKNIETGKYYVVEKTDIRCNDPLYIKENYYFGKRHLEISKEKMSNTCKIRFENGASGSMTGRRWIYNSELKQNKTILKTEELPIGWLEGKLQKSYPVKNNNSINNIQPSLTKLEKQKKYEEFLNEKNRRIEQKRFEKEQKHLKKEKAKIEYINNLRLLYLEYCETGYKGVQTKFDYKYSKPNLVNSFMRYLPEFVPQNGKKRSKDIK